MVFRHYASPSFLPLPVSWLLAFLPLPVSWLLSCLSLLISWLVGALIHAIAYKKGKWRNKVQSIQTVAE